MKKKKEFAIEKSEWGPYWKPQLSSMVCPREKATPNLDGEIGTFANTVVPHTFRMAGKGQYLCSNLG